MKLVTWDSRLQPDWNQINAALLMIRNPVCLVVWTPGDTAIVVCTKGTRQEQAQAFADKKYKP